MKHGTGWIIDPEDTRDYQYDHLVFGAPQFNWDKGFDIEELLGFKLKSKNQNGSSSCVGQASSYLGHVINSIEVLGIEKEIFLFDVSLIRELVSNNIGEQGEKNYSIGNFSQDFLTKMNRHPEKKEIDVFIKLRENERRRRNKNTKLFAKELEMSAKSIYSQIYLDTGGAFLKDGISKIVNWGLLPESRIPSYEGFNPPSEEFMRRINWKNEEADLDAKIYQGKQYRIIVSKDIDTMAKAIEDGYGVLTGIVGSNSGKWTSKFPKPPIDGEKLWYHALYAGKAKMINGKKYIGVKNSWGDVGDDGWQWLGEDYFSSGNVMNARILIDKPNSGLVKLIDRKGKPRRIPASWISSISKFIYEHNYKLV